MLFYFDQAAKFYKGVLLTTLGNPVTQALNCGLQVPSYALKWLGENSIAFFGQKSVPR